jgi:hypothetical protein
MTPPRRITDGFRLRLPVASAMVGSHRVRRVRVGQLLRSDFRRVCAIRLAPGPDSLHARYNAYSFLQRLGYSIV